MIKDQEDRQEYFKIKDKTQVLRVRLNAYEQRLLQAAMRREGWQNISGYVKYQLFGMNSKIEYEKLLREGTEEELGRVLADGMKNVNMILNYIRFRYDKDMAVLYHQEGVDVKNGLQSPTTGIPRQYPCWKTSTSPAEKLQSDLVSSSSSKATTCMPESTRTSSPRSNLTKSPRNCTTKIRPCLQVI